MVAHGGDWGEAAWTVLLRRVLPRVLASPPAATTTTATSSSTAAAAAAAVSSFISRAGEAFPGLCDRLATTPLAVRGELLTQLSSTCLQWMSQVWECVGGGRGQGGRPSRGCVTGRPQGVCVDGEGGGKFERGGYAKACDV